MPGKVNPTQAEAMLMVAIQVLGNDSTIAMAGKEGNFELNAFRPVIIANLLHSMRILADMCHNLRRFMIDGAQLNSSQIKQYVDRSVMMVTALAPVIGYDKASAIAHTAIDDDLTLKDAAIKCGVSEELFDRVVVPIELTKPGSADRP
jgi:fumarate hydratase class II